MRLLHLGMKGLPQTAISTPIQLLNMPGNSNSKDGIIS